MIFEQVGIIGCGLIGCSFAQAVKKAGVAKHIVGYSKSPTATEEAKALGILDETAPSAMQVASGSDLILIATPVGAMAQIFVDIVSLVTPNTLIMDVGSTKQNVVAAARQGLKKKINNFVPAHPIAGKNMAGYQASDADLFQHANVVLTPLEKTAQTHLNNAIAVWEAIGAQVQLMNPKEHDHILGAVSHFPHLLAFAYMSGIINHTKKDRFLALAGPGFKDFTRIAASEPTLWRDVFMANKEEMLTHIADFKKVLTQYEGMLQKDDATKLLESLKESSEARHEWGPEEEVLNAPLASPSVEHNVKDGLFSRLFGYHK